MLHVPWAQTKALQYSFAVNGPNIWNSLPAALQMLDSCLVSFMHNLRTHLTMTAWPPTGALVTLQYCCARYNLDTYLLTYFAFYICSSVLSKTAIRRSFQLHVITMKTRKLHQHERTWNAWTFSKMSSLFNMSEICISSTFWVWNSTQLLIQISTVLPHRPRQCK